ncbi:MAG: DUF2264 domain-containing protein [Ferruginibacter sp.]|nr:DUF2264 domain-containing protein [Ferruginibacter sp.]
MGGENIKLISLLIVLTGFCHSMIGQRAENEYAVDKSFTSITASYDFSKNPYTGYTRKHWLEITEKIIAGELIHLSSKTGMPQIRIPIGDSAYEKIRWKNEAETGKRVLERMMLAVIIYTKATGKDEVPGFKGSISAPFIKAMINGTDPASPQYWGDPITYDQVGAVFAMAVYIEPKRYWEPLTPEQKTNLLKYFQKQSYTETYNNNHYYFHMIATEILDRYGFESNREHLTQMFERLMGWYRGDGWFLDGNNRTFDYYNLWGFQLFNQVLYKYDHLWRREFGDRIKTTTAKFLECLPYLHGKDGGPIPWGRSLAYRFAGNSAIAWATINGMNTLAPGLARRIASGSLKYFWEHGCMGSDSLLSIGYWGNNASVAEIYLHYGDPYWANQGLACLLIPENDAFWTDTEKPMPADKAGGRISVIGAQFSIRINAADGESRLFPVGQQLAKDRTIWQSGSKYDQHAYSSYLGFCLNGDENGQLGAGRSGYSYDGINWFYRERAKPILVDTNYHISSYTLTPKYASDSIPYFNRDEIITHTLVGNDGEVYVFWHNDPQPIYLYLGGYGLSVPRNKKLFEQVTNKKIFVNGGDYYSVIEVIQAPEGKLEAITLLPGKGWSHTHLFGGKGAFPFWHSTKPVPPNVPVIFFVNGTRNRTPADNPVQVTKQGSVLKLKFEGKWHEIKVPF